MTEYNPKINNQNIFLQNSIIKASIFKLIREFFDQKGFLEFDSPNMVLSPDPSPFNEVFETKSISGDRIFLTPSPEFFLKKAIAGGLRNIYQLTKACRDNQEKDPVHLKEFTILEWYRDGATYLDLMHDCENIVNYVFDNLSKIQNSKFKIQNCHRRLAGSRTMRDSSKFNIIEYNNIKVNLSSPWQRISCKEAFEKYANVNLDEFMEIENARKTCVNKGYQVNTSDTWEELYHQIFLNEVEPKLPKDQPLILYDYPAPLAALSKIKKDNPLYVERFEFYIGGLELGNGYSELTDKDEQIKRLENDLKIRKEKGMKTFEYDKEFVNAVGEMPKTAGIAVGIDRLIMLFTNSPDIHEVSPFSL